VRVERLPAGQDAAAIVLANLLSFGLGLLLPQV
jgi:hypothetical protein